MPESERMDSQELPARRIAIAYEWVLAPIDFSDYDIALSIGRSDSANLSEPVAVTTYRAHLPGRRKANAQSDVSGNSGLVFAVADDGAETRAGASERLIADAIIWELSKLSFSDTKTEIFIQGPMLPKVRGRLLYRGLPPHIQVWGITWQPEWFWRLEASNQLLRNIEIQVGDTEMVSPIVSPMYPPEGIDRASRSWVCKSGRKSAYHFEMLTNTWDFLIADEWKHAGDRIKDFAGIPAPDGSGRYLPSVMRSVGESVRNQNEVERGYLWFLPQLREVKHDPMQLASKSSDLKELLKFIDPALFRDPAHQPAGLFQNTEPIDWANEAAVRAAFRNNPKEIVKLLPGTAGQSG